MNRFYKSNRIVQWTIGVLMMLILTICMVMWFLVENNLLRLALVFFMVPIYMLLYMPILTLVKKYNYLSPMLMYLKRKENIFELHSGSSFDYLWTIKQIKPGIDWRNRMLQYYIDDLIKIVQKIKNGSIPETSEITGTSYFMGNSLTKNLGFDTMEANPMDKANFFLSYLDLIWMYSLSRGKIQFPKFSSLQRAVISGEQLLKSENLLIKYQSYFEDRISEDN